MSLKPFGTLPPDHHLVGAPCHVCGDPVLAGVDITFVSLGLRPAGQNVITPDTKLAIAHWECVRQVDEQAKKAKQKARHAYSWVAPRDAAAPLNHFDTLSLRLTRIHRGLIREARKSPEVLNSPAFAELVDSCADLAKTAAEMTTTLEEIRRDFPKLWDVWCAAVIDEKPQRW